VRGDRIGLGWAGGFLDAVALRPHTWESLIEDEVAGIPLVPLFLLTVISKQAADQMVASMKMRSWQKPQRWFLSLLSASMSSGGTTGAIRTHRRAADHEAADARDTTAGIKPQHDGSGRQSHSESRRR
jgi:hypothetical protein